MQTEQTLDLMENIKQQFVSTCEVGVIYGCARLLLKVLGCIYYVLLYNHIAPGPIDRSE